MCRFTSSTNGLQETTLPKHVSVSAYDMVKTFASCCSSFSGLSRFGLLLRWCSTSEECEVAEHHHLQALAIDTLPFMHEKNEEKMAALDHCTLDNN